MPTAQRRITDSLSRSLPAPAAGYVIHWCPGTPGFGVRVSATGDRAYVSERRVDGKTVRRTLGKAAGSGAISAAVARELQVEVSSELQKGVDRAEVKRAERRQEREDATTFREALEAYVKGKRRGKDGLPLKDRTRADYLAMAQPGRERDDGSRFADGALCGIADRPVAKITAADVRGIYETQAKRSQRQATYAMQVLRAVLNWHGVAVPDSPLSKTTAGKDRIVLPSTTGNARPIPPERLGAWWRAASARGGAPGADGLRFMLLSGARPGEVFGFKRGGKTLAAGLLVEHVDLIGGRATLTDTKNRRDHVVVLSRQAAVLLRQHCEGKKPGAKVFDVIDPGKALAAINGEAGTPQITAHKLRHTFASIAEELVSAYALKALLNHTAAGDVTSGYVGKSETQLRAAWQAVADAIEAA